jgi:Holliday junction resolvase RusA-like endonuclease
MWTCIFKQAIPGQPVQLNRPRFSRNGVFHDSKNKQAKQDIIKLLMDSCPVGLNVQPEQPLSLVIEFIHSRPNRLKRKKDTTARIPKITKPDLDNLIKMIMDALQATPLMHDDRQVIMLCCSDWWAAKDEEAHTQISLFSMEPYNA